MEIVSDCASWRLHATTLYISSLAFHNAPNTPTARRRALTKIRRPSTRRSDSDSARSMCKEEFKERSVSFRAFGTLPIYPAADSTLSFATMRVPASVAAGLVLLSGCAVAGLSAAIHWTSFAPIGYYVALLCGFHVGEFLWSWRFEGKGLTFDAFLLNQNWPEYQLAIVAALVEYAIEAAFFPSLKSLNPLSACGLALCLVGLAIRAAGMWTAGSNFAHRIAEQRRPDHMLVRHGIYSVFRHPSYVGWTYWSLGTQLLLCNPVCLSHLCVRRHTLLSRPH